LHPLIYHTEISESKTSKQDIHLTQSKKTVGGKKELRTEWSIDRNPVYLALPHINSWSGSIMPVSEREIIFTTLSSIRKKDYTRHFQMLFH